MNIGNGVLAPIRGHFMDMFTLIVVAAVAVAGWGIVRPLLALKALSQPPGEVPGNG